MKRRQFINNSLLSMASAAGVQVLGMNTLKAAASTSPKKLFVVFLRGGFDGLLGLPSAANFADIKARRPGCYIDSNYAILGNYNNLFRAHKDWRDILNVKNGLAIFPHAGSLNQTRSHFEQMDIIEGGIHTSIAGDGYLSRAAIETGKNLGSVAIGSPVPKSLRGKADPLVISDVNSLLPTVRVPGAARSAVTMGIKERLEFIAQKASAEDCPPEARACLSAHGAASTFALASLPEDTTNNPFDLAAAVSLTPLKPSIITIDVGGWDIHDDAVSRMTGNGGLLKNLADGLTLLKTKLQAAGEWNNSMIVVMSEFGRTITANGTDGFDHGRGGLMMVMGGKVQKPTNTAFLQKWDLTQTDGTGPSQSFAVKTDYRDVMSQIFIKHLGLSAKQVKDYVFPTLGVIRDPGFIIS